MTNIYETTDSITPAISFHKSIAVDGGIVAKSASLGNSHCKLVVNDDGVYIVVPSRFDNAGNLSETNYRRYNLGAMVEAIQELNRRTAWMETDMTLSESLNGTDVIVDNNINPGALYNNAADLLPGLKQTIPYGNYFRLVNTNGDAIRIYQITEEYSGLLTTISALNPPLLDPAEDDCFTTIKTIMDNDTEYTVKYVSPRILNITETSFDILVLDTVDNSSTNHTLSDEYYTYTLIGIDEYKANLKKGVTIEDICTDGNKIISPIPYICKFNNTTERIINVTQPLLLLDVTSFAGLFKDRTELTGEIDFSDWDFSRITNMSGMFEGCSGITSIYFGNNSLENNSTRTINTDYIFEGCSSNLTITRNMYSPFPAFIYDPETADSEEKKTLTLNGTTIMDTSDKPVSCNGYVWKMIDGDAVVYCRFGYTSGGSAPYSFYMVKYALNNNELTYIG